LNTLIAAVLQTARAQGVERLDAQLLLAHVLGRNRSWVIAHADDALTPAQAEAAQSLIRRRASGEPLAYLVGEREFRGLRLIVTPDVLIPRPDTETLVEWAIELMRGQSAPCIADLGTGSGAIALALKHALPQADLHASDASAAALAVARANGERLALPVQWHRGSWFDALPAALQFDLVVSNPPYVAPGDPHLAALRHEPIGALVPAADDGDGLADVRRIANGAVTRLSPGGWLLVEHGAEQGEAARRVLAEVGLANVVTRCDLAGRERVVAGRRAG
jgi:release factor glutamine methyltransferase